jgi:magnesium transporter
MNAIQMNVRKITNDCGVSLLYMTGRFETKIIDRLGIMQMTGLHSRDVRLHLPNQPVGLFIRNKCIIVNMFYIKIIIMYDRLIIYDIEKDQKIKSLIGQIQEKLRSDKDEKDEKITFEFIILDFLLNDICAHIRFLYEELRLSCDPLLSDLLNMPTKKGSLLLLPIKNNLKKLDIKIKNIYDSLDDLLENAPDMKQMYLTYFQGHMNELERKELDHNAMEDLLETYFAEIDKVLDKLTVMESNIEETDDTVRMTLDISRNKSMGLDLWINMMTLILSIGNWVTGLFGMNVTNHAETSENVFYAIIASIVLISLIVYLIFRYKSDKIKMEIN